MRARKNRPLTVGAAAVILDLTSWDICRLLRLGRLSGTKKKIPGRQGKSHWLIDRSSVAKYKRDIARLAASARK